MTAEVMMKEYKNIFYSIQESDLEMIIHLELNNRFHALLPSGRGKGADEHSF